MGGQSERPTEAYRYYPAIQHVARFASEVDPSPLWYNRNRRYANHWQRDVIVGHQSYESSVRMQSLTSEVRLTFGTDSAMQVWGWFELILAVCLGVHGLSPLQASPQKATTQTVCSERNQSLQLKDLQASRWEAAEEHFARGEQFESASDQKSAEDEFRAAVTQMPRADKYVRRLALFELERQRYDDAIGVIKEYVNLCGATALGWALESELLFKKRQYDAAYEAAQNSLHLANDDARMHEMLGLIYITKRQNAAAAIELGKATTLDPEHPQIRYFYGRTLYSTGRFPEARDQFIACLRIQPQYPRALENLGLCYEALRDYTKAFDCYRKAISAEEVKKGHKNAEPYAYYGRLLLQTGESEEALSVLRQAVGASPRSFIANFELGNALLSVGELRDAERFLLAAENLDSKFARTYYLLGRLCQKQKRPQEAAQYWATFEALQFL